MRVERVPYAAAPRPAGKPAQPRVEDLFLEGRPQAPVPPKKGWKLRWAGSLRKAAPVACPLLGGVAGALAGLKTGGWGAAFGVAAGISAAPVVGLVGVAASFLAGAVIVPLTHNDDVALYTAVGLTGLSLLSSPVLGYFIGRAASGPWWAAGTAAASAIGGLAIGLGLSALMDDSSGEWEYERKVRDHQEKLKKHQEEVAAWEQRRAEALGEQRDQANLTIEKDEKQVVVGGVTLGRKPQVRAPRTAPRQG